MKFLDSPKRHGTSGGSPTFAFAKTTWRYVLLWPSANAMENKSFFPGTPGRTFHEGWGNPSAFATLHAFFPLRNRDED
jgi:hypothetical protein